jgi:predicted PurR-regulated permease PerM
MDNNDNAFAVLAAFVCFFAFLFIISKPFASDGIIDWSKEVPKAQKASSEAWVPATKQEVESGQYEIRVDYGGRGTRQYWKRLKK